MTKRPGFAAPAAWLTAGEIRPLVRIALVVVIVAACTVAVALTF